MRKEELQEEVTRMIYNFGLGVGDPANVLATRIISMVNAAQQSVQPDLGWTCAHCGRKNKGNFCSNCGFGATYRPSR